MIFETILLSIIIGKINKGKIKNIEALYIKGWYFIVLSFIINIISFKYIRRIIYIFSIFTIISAQKITPRIFYFMKKIYIFCEMSKFFIILHHIISQCIAANKKLQS
jgi:hypothetical protein